MSTYVGSRRLYDDMIEDEKIRQNGPTKDKEAYVVINSRYYRKSHEYKYLVPLIKKIVRDCGIVSNPTSPFFQLTESWSTRKSAQDVEIKEDNEEKVAIYEKNGIFVNRYGPRKEVMKFGEEDHEEIHEQIDDAFLIITHRKHIPFGPFQTLFKCLARCTTCDICLEKCLAVLNGSCCERRVVDIVRGAAVCKTMEADLEDDMEEEDMEERLVPVTSWGQEEDDVPCTPQCWIGSEDVNIFEEMNQNELSSKKPMASSPIDLHKLCNRTPNRKSRHGDALLSHNYHCRIRILCSELMRKAEPPVYITEEEYQAEMWRAVGGYEEKRKIELRKRKAERDREEERIRIMGLSEKEMSVESGQGSSSNTIKNNSDLCSEEEEPGKRVQSLQTPPTRAEPSRPLPAASSDKNKEGGSSTKRETRRTAQRNEVASSDRVLRSQTLREKSTTTFSSNGEPKEVEEVDPVPEKKARVQPFPSHQPIAMAQSLLPGDIETLPHARIVFNAPYDDKHTYHIKVTNWSAGRIGYRIKTTNEKRLTVDPPCGVLDPKETIFLAVSCDAFAYGQEDTKNDRLTIDWTNTPDGAAKQFCREWFQGDVMIRRMSLTIKYNP